jgi:DNA polymerase-3 subunit gamma/tau
VSTALYRKYRSKSLDEIVGQPHITDILKRAIKAGRISHAYLLTGPKGVGKTSVARILAHEINQLPYSDDSTHLDIIEIDAASNNGVEDVRDLREKVQLAPVSAKKKVYIIDEVHMLSKAAFNALLKTLEEPPEHIVFILATTDVDKLPATIVSRTQRYGFRAIAVDDAIKHLRHIADTEKIKIDDASLAIIAERSDGSFRDSISLLDQLASLADTKEGITAELVETTLGLAPHTVVDDLLKLVEAGDVTAIATLLNQTIADGISAVTLTQQLTLKLRELVPEKPQLLPLLDGLLDVPKSSQPALKLLSTLGTAAYDQKPSKTAALSAPVLEVSATIKELTTQATRVKPAMKAVEPVEAPSLQKDVPERASQAPQAEQSSPVKRPSEKKSDSTGDLAAQSADFDSKKLVDYTKKHFVALYSVLCKCAFDLQGSNLTIYAINNFYKKKLDDPKYSSHLYESLEALGYQLTIHTIPTPLPPRDSKAAAIAVIMGGGEEVSVEAS